MSEQVINNEMSAEQIEENNRTTNLLRQNKLFLATPMYGGQCAGIYTKSISELNAICAQIGIPIQTFYLFNESLITRARNYCVDEFLRSDATHFIFVDSDIGFDPRYVLNLMALQANEPEKYNIIGGPYPKKSLPGKTLVTTEDGQKTIKSIVDNKYTGKVATIDKNNNIVWNNIIQHHVNENRLKWIELKLSNHRLYKKLICTYDHEIFYTENPLKPTLSGLRADNLLGKYIAKTPLKDKKNALYNKEIISALVGTLLGDGHITKSKGILSVGHGFQQKQYVEFKQKLFGGTVNVINTKSGYNINDDAKSVRLTSPFNEQVKYLRDIMYVDGKKTIKNILEYLDPISLALWYMDNGCLKKSGNTSYYIELNTQGFSDEDQEILVNWFNKNYNFDVKIDETRSESKSKNGKIFKRIRLKNEDSSIFLNMVAPYITESMNYKLPEKYHNIQKHLFNTEKLSFALAKVTEINYIDLDSKQYDIGVENNHNFIANGIHVFNSISWEKIKYAVDKGVSDDDPNILEKYVGDYVFNPLTTTGSVNLGQPVEVLELGTGFMMIHRDVFLKFKEAYPQYTYIPDHVRSKQFDGSREIMMYFQAEIDQNKRYLSEDYWFTQKTRDIGIKTWICPWMELKHMGTYVFGGSLVDLVKLGVAATADPSKLGTKN